MIWSKLCRLQKVLPSISGRCGGGGMNWMRSYYFLVMEFNVDTKSLEDRDVTGGAGRSVRPISQEMHSGRQVGRGSGRNRFPAAEMGSASGHIFPA